MKVLTFGELLLRLSSPGYTKLFQKDSLDATFCGGEANVAVSLAEFGIDSQFLTKLPQNDVGRAAERALKYFGVDTSKIVYGEGRMGLYYLEKGASQRPSKVIYDRQYSAVSLAQASEFDWDYIFENVTWFHWTGITPALSDSLAQICLVACQKAQEYGVTVSCDLNYRKTLWASEKAQRVMQQLVKYVDVCIANEEDAEMVLGIVPKDTDVSRGKLNLEGYRDVANQIAEQYGCRYVAITLRKSYSASRNGWSGMLYNSNTKEMHRSAEYDIQIVDRVGGGDSFAAGIIYGIITSLGDREVIDFAIAASCLKQTMEGDFNRSTVDDVYALLQTGGNGRVVR